MGGAVIFFIKYDVSENVTQKGAGELEREKASIINPFR